MRPAPQTQRAAFLSPKISPKVRSGHLQACPDEGTGGPARNLRAPLLQPPSEAGAVRATQTVTRHKIAVAIQRVPNTRNPRLAEFSFSNRSELKNC